MTLNIVTRFTVLPDMLEYCLRIVAMTPKILEDRACMRAGEVEFTLRLIINVSRYRQSSVEMGCMWGVDAIEIYNAGSKHAREK